MGIILSAIFKHSINIGFVCQAIFFSLHLFSYYHIPPLPSNKLHACFAFFSLYTFFFCASILMEIFID